MLIPSVQRTINTSPGVTIISVETVIRTMAALISRSLSATLKDRESPAGRLCPLRRVSLFREEKVVVKEGRLHGMRLLHRPRGIDPPFDTARPWLCTPLSQISLDTRATRASFEGPFLRPLPPVDLELKITSVKVAFYCRFPRCLPPFLLAKKFGSDCRGIPAGFEAFDSNLNWGWRICILA